MIVSFTSVSLNFLILSDHYVFNLPDNFLGYKEGIQIEMWLNISLNWSLGALFSVFLKEICIGYMH